MQINVNLITRTRHDLEIAVISISSNRPVAYIQVFFTAAIRAKRYHGKPPHILQVQHNPDQFHKSLGTEVLVDILLLAKCDHFLHIESSVAALASYFNPHMKSHFLDDMPRKVSTLSH